MTKILILHGVNYYNAGDHGIVLSMVRALREAIPGVDLKVSSPFLANNRTESEFVNKVKSGFLDIYPEEIPDIYQVPVGKKRRIHIIYYALKIVLFAAFMTILPFFARPYLARASKFGSAVLDADIVLSKGGGFLLDRGTTYSIPTHLITIWISVLLRKKTIIYAQSVGPFEKYIGRQIAKFVLKRVTYIFARDKYSEEYSVNVLGVRSEKVILTADSAFELSSALDEGEPSLKVLAPPAAPRGQICITLVSPLYSGLNEQKAEDTYCETIASVAEYIADRGYKIIFIPHLESGAHSDRILAQRIRSQCSARTQAVTEVLPPMNPLKIINLMAQCDLGLCSRMHSMIFAIDAKLPFVALSYLPKSESMLEEANLIDWKLSLPELAQGSVSDSSGAIVAKLEAMIAQLPENQAKVRAAQALFAGRARTNIQLLTKTLSGFP